MHMEIVDLYQNFGIDSHGVQGGRLRCWTWQTSGEVSGGRRRPGILVIPGGGYEHVSAREAEPVAMRFIARGYCAFVLEYSVERGVRFPTALREAAMAMRYIRENAARFEVDPAQVAAIGFSAGGHLCGTLGTMYDCPEVADIASGPVIRPDALGLCYPVAISWGPTHEGSFRNLCGEDGALWKRMSLDAQVRADMPPVFLWHTRDDGAVPVRNSLILAQALDEKGVDFAVHIFRHGQHGLSTADAQVFPADKLPEISENIRNWPEMAMDFFAEKGFAIAEGNA